MINHHFLRFISSETVANLVPKWNSDKTVTKYLNRGKLPSNILSNQLSSDIEFEIVVDMSGSSNVIGCAGLHQINWVSRSAELRILIGETEYWGKGFGKSTIRELLDYGFSTINLNRIWLGVNEHNHHAHSAYISCGFRQEGRLRDEFYKAGKYCDVIRMGLLRHEFIHSVS